MKAFANHTGQIFIPANSLRSVVATPDGAEDGFFPSKDREGEPEEPTVTVTVTGDGVRFEEHYLNRAKANEALTAMGYHMSVGEGVFFFPADPEYEERVEAMRAARAKAKEDAKPAYRK